jgi:hypothetical protein
MNKVKNLTSHTNNEEHLGFNTETNGLILSFEASNLKIVKPHQVYQAAINEEDEAYKKIMKSSLTENISDADSLRDNLYQGIVETVRTALRHFREEVVVAAKRLIIVFDTYGNVAKMSLAKESVAIDNIMQELEGAYADDVKTVGIAEWVPELKKANITVKSLMTARDDEKATKTTLDMKETRAKVDAAYSNIITCLEAFSITTDEPLFDEFIHRLNIIIERYNNAVAQREGRAKAKKKAEDSNSDTEGKKES